MFTPDGRVREEFAAPDEAAPAEETPAAAATAPPADTPVPAPVAEPEVEPAVDTAAPAPRLELPATPAAQGAPSFYDLVALLAEPASIYLGDLQFPDGESAENLELARLHIDLLDLLRQRTAGNLTAQELGVLEDLLYRLRVRYVQKRG